MGKEKVLLGTIPTSRSCFPCSPAGKDVHLETESASWNAGVDALRSRTMPRQLISSLNPVATLRGCS